MIAVDSACLFSGAQSEEPRIHCDRKRVKDRGLARRIVADNKIEVRIKVDPAASKLLEILDR